MTRFCIAALFAFAFQGCATLRRDSELGSRIADVVHTRSLDDLWPKVREVARERGFTFVEVRDGPVWVLQTDWRGHMEESEMTASWQRLVIVGRDVGLGRSVVHVFTQSRSSGGNTRHSYASYTESSWSGLPASFVATYQPGTPVSMARSVSKEIGGVIKLANGMSYAGRDLRFEWELFRRVEPAAAAQLERELDSDF
jgi:hypothetical protein